MGLLVKIVKYSLKSCLCYFAVGPNLYFILRTSKMNTRAGFLIKITAYSKTKSFDIEKSVIYVKI